ncbi:TniQ family protein [Paraburkholderia bannensis]|uniref:TniQ family protein n=1 Tax=Paraburkholderia bannensis TaxID=765414 RepID=UPI002AC36F1E|nr:TniQ family protein [Paraburkholderia bannensis]
MNGRFHIPPRLPFRIETHGHGSQRQKLTDIFVQIGNQSFLPLPALARHYSLQGDKPFATGNHLEQINGLGSMAERWAKNLGKMTGRHDLSRHTLLPFRGVFGRTTGLLTRRRRWCPLCLYEDVESGGRSYERLIWAIDVVQICPIHHVAFEDSCRTCGKRCTREMAIRQVSGLCEGCGRWLGREEVDCDFEDDDPRYVFERWIAGGFAGILDMPDAEVENLCLENISLMVRAGISTVGDGKAVRFGVACGKQKSVISGWQSGQVVPSLQTMVSLSWRFSVPLNAWLSGRTQAWEDASLRASPFGMTRSNVRRSPRKPDLEKLRRHLTVEVEKKAPARSFAEVARGLSYDPSFLRRKFPTLARAISKRYTHELLLAAASRRQEYQELIKSTAAEVVKLLVKAGKVPSRRSVEAMMSERGVPVRRADYHLLRAAIANRQRR